MAYYKTMKGVCNTNIKTLTMDKTSRNGLIQSFTALASGSAFFHAQGDKFRIS